MPKATLRGAIQYSMPIRVLSVMATPDGSYTVELELTLVQGKRIITLYEGDSDFYQILDLELNLREGDKP